MSTNNELEKFRQGTPEEIEKKLEEQKKKSLELARDGGINNGLQKRNS